MMYRDRIAQRQRARRLRKARELALFLAQLLMFAMAVAGLLAVTA